MTASRGRGRRTVAALAAVSAIAALTAGCTEDDAGETPPSGARGAAEPALTLVQYSRWSDLALHDCASLDGPARSTTARSSSGSG